MPDRLKIIYFFAYLINIVIALNALKKSLCGIGRHCDSSFIDNALVLFLQFHKDFIVRSGHAVASDAEFLFIYRFFQ